MTAETVASPAPDPEAFRAAFPILGRVRYLNAGTEGPVPAAATAAVEAQLDADLHRGRIGEAYLHALLDRAEAARAGYAGALGAPLDTVALTDSTTSGINTVLGGLRWQAGDEVLTSDQEHPGLLAPLRRLAVRHGVSVRVAPFAELAAAVGPRTRLVAASHVSWVAGEVADVAALRATGAPVLLDGAQSLGAIPVDVVALGVDFYAGSGQKWLCGPEGSGALYVRADRLGELEPPWPNYGSLAEPGNALASALAPGAGRLDIGFPPAVRSAWATAAFDLFASVGWDWIWSRAVARAAELADALVAAGLAVAPRGASTLVSWTPPGGRAPDAEVTRLAADGILVRSIPSHGLLRASCGAWTSAEDVAALVAAAAAA